MFHNANLFGSYIIHILFTGCAKIKKKKKSGAKGLTVPDRDRFLDITVKFQERWNFPNVNGCIDGKHIRIKCPTEVGPLFYNHNFCFL